MPFQPKPTSVSILAIPEAVDPSYASGSNEFSGDSNHTTMPKAEPHEDLHAANTVILENGRGRNSPRPPPPAPPQRIKTQPPPPPPAQPRSRPSPPGHNEFEDVHSAPTMIIEPGRARRRGRG